MFCEKCGASNDDNAKFCGSCGVPIKAKVFTGEVIDSNNTQTNQNASNAINDTEQKQKIVAGVLGIVLGGLGMHNFYLGFTSKGVIQIVVTLVTCGVGSWWGVIEGILILTGNINQDANGKPLKG